ncbi:hypothetical protein HPP92_017077 [Vanilla planifolia]|uniref:Uncharacterized protein n=1 Tax=Vanilla planifolia TaxID=51239 RepID=A0A835UQL2_VANPL|nr:hypothetical protein HPP92_017077 [Vanilla planifolia]
MAQGFRGMKDDFMELINYVMAISCFPFANGDDHSLHPPLLAAGDSDGLGVSEVPLPVDSAGRDAATLAIVPGSALASTATVNEGPVNSFPQGPKVEKEELVESLNNSCYPTSVNNANSCTESQIAGTKCTTNQNLETRGSAESPSFILANVLEGRSLDSSNAENEGGCYTNMEEEDVSIVKHFSNPCSLIRAEESPTSVC